MFPIRVKTVQESDLRMLGSLARNIQRVLPVTQADIDAAAALGKGWVVWKVFEVSDPLDNLRGGTQLIIRQNSIQPGQNVRRVIFVSGPGGQTVVIRGTDYIVLPDAIANSLSYVKAFGGTEQNGTPTPDTPVDIVSNNGVLKIQGSATGTVTQTGNPTPTTPVDPVFYQNHGLLLRAIGADADTYDASTQTITRNIGYKIFDGTESFGTSSAYGQALYISGAASAWGADRNKDVLCQYFLGASSPSGTMPEFTCFFNQSGHFYFRTTETATDFKAWLAELYANGTPLIVWFVNSTPETESFTPSVYADSIVETINAHGKNLNGGGELVHQGYTSTGGTSTSTTFCGTLWKIKVNPGEKYTVSYGNFPDGVSGVFISTWLADGTWNTRQASAISGAYTYTIPAGVGEVNFTLYKTGGITIASNSWLQVEKGDTATEYQPYYDGGTATAEMLLRLDGAVDEQEILTGAVIRNVKVIVFDGTESFTASTTYGKSCVMQSASNIWGADRDVTPICTHFLGAPRTSGNRPDYTCFFNATGHFYFRLEDNTVATFKAWLAAQYDAGTPVMLLVGAATPTTESVAGQTLQVTDGDNVLEITQASLTGLELEAQYNAAVSLTIQEVQDANLDNNVTVTIQ